MCMFTCTHTDICICIYIYIVSGVWSLGFSAFFLEKLEPNIFHAPPVYIDIYIYVHI